jgi:ribosomal protein L6P/L9E
MNVKKISIKTNKIMILKERNQDFTTTFTIAPLNKEHNSLCLNLKTKTLLNTININDKLLFLKGINETQINSILHLLKNALKGSEQFFFVNLNIKGLGFRIRCFSKNEMCFLRLELGFSHFILYPIPSSLFFLKGKKRIVFYTSDFDLLSRIVTQLISLRKANPYKEKGLLIANKVYKKKSGKQQQR